MSSTDRRYQDIIDAAKASVDIEKRVIEVGGIPVAINGQTGSVAVLDSVLEAAEDRASAPARRRGTMVIHTPDSLSDIVKRYRTEHSLLWADAERGLVECVFNEVPAGSDESAAGWRDFRALYKTQPSPEWRTWTYASGQDMSQDDFAQFIEDHVENVVSAKDYPKGIELLEMARDLTIHTKGVYSKQLDPTTGTSSLICKTEHESSSTKIPRAFLLALRPFDGGVMYQVEAVIRLRLGGGRPVFSFTIRRQLEVMRDAFADLAKGVATATEVPLLFGVAGA